MSEALTGGKARAKLVEMIGEAERGNRGEVRVHIENKSPSDDVMDRAKQLFGKLGMHKTRDDTAVLLYLAIVDRKVAVYAGKGIHGAAEEGFWGGVAAEVAGGFKAGDSLGGLCNALEMIGHLLREHAPGDDTAGDELPNQVTTS